MSKEFTELKRELFRKRRGYPPHYLAARLASGVPVAGLPGTFYERLERGFAPTAAEVRLILIRFRETLRWPRSQLAAFVGVDQSVLRRWESGERRPSGAARRLIWLLELLTNEPDNFKSAFDLIIWGRGQELQKIQ